MKMISWNVNGIRACVGKNFMDFFKEADADIFCIQESKMQEGQLQLASGLLSILELCREKGIFRNCYFRKERAVVSGIWNRYRRTRP